MNEKQETYLNAHKLAELISCKPNQFGTMKRWLIKNNWPFEIDRKGFPKVLRQYHDERMSGKTVGSTDSSEGKEDEISIDTHAMLSHLKKESRSRRNNGTQTR